MVFDKSVLSRNISRPLPYGGESCCASWSCGGFCNDLANWAVHYVYLEMVWGFFIVYNDLGIHWGKLSTLCILLIAHCTLEQCTPSYIVDVHCCFCNFITGESSVYFPYAFPCVRERCIQHECHNTYVT